jgi:hypothetical protein
VFYRSREAWILKVNLPDPVVTVGSLNFAGKKRKKRRWEFTE